MSMSTDTVLPSENKSPWIHSSTQWIEYCPMKWRCHQVSVTEMRLSSMHLVNVLWSSHVLWVVVPSDITVPDMHCQFCAHSECPLAQFRTGIASHQFHTHWMFTKSPASVVSPVSSTLNVQGITCLCHLTTFTHTECPPNHQSLFVSHQPEAKWMFTQSPVSHQFHAQRMSAGIVLPSESHVSVTSVLCKFYVHWNGGVTRSTCLNVSQSPRLPFMYTVNVPALTQRCHQRSSVSHCPVSVSCIQQCPLNGAARLDHQSTATRPQCFTPPPPPQVYSDKWCWHQRSPITATSCQQSICVHNERWHYTSQATAISHQLSVLMIHSRTQ